MGEPVGLRRVPKKPPPSVEGWIGYLRKALKVRRTANYGSEDLLVQTAALFGLFGPPGDPKATEVYQNLVRLLLPYHRIQQWSRALDRIPADVESVMRVSRAVTAASLIEPVEQAKFPAVKFIEVALQLPDSMAFVEVCKKDGLRLIRAAFHPNTLMFVSERYRGVVGPLADTEYRALISGSIKTVS